MNGHFLKRVPVTLVALTASLSIFAAVDTDTRLKQLEQQMKQVRTETAAGTFGAKTASARPEVNGAGVSFTIDALLWKANVGGTEYAYTDSSALGAFPINGSMQDIDFGWDWGVKVGIGYNYAHDNWETDLLFTYFSSNESDTTTAGTASSVIPLKGSADLGFPLTAVLDYCSTASSQFKFVYDNLDLDLARNYFVSESLALRPHFGLKSTWLDLQQDTRYTGGALSQGITFYNADKSKFWGIGPSAGINTKWYLCNGFGLFGDASGALLWSYFQVKHFESNSVNVNEDQIGIRANMHRFVPTAQLSLGISYDSYMNDNKQHINVSLGWETVYYWRANQMLTVDDFASKKYSRVSEDISMQGVTLNVRLDF
jgi:hypothetical protein